MLEMIYDPNRIRMEEVSALVCKHFGLEHDQIFSLSRKRRFIRPRQVFMLLARELTGETLADIGGYCKRNHASVINSLSTVKKRIAENSTLNQTVSSIRFELMGLWDGRHDRSQPNCMHCVNQLAYPPRCFGHPVDELKCDSFLDNQKFKDNHEQV